MNAPVKFFYRHAGYSWDPAKETKHQGRLHCARSLAQAERIGQRIGLSFEWEIDPYHDSSEWSDEIPPWAQWTCVCRGPRGVVRASLGGIDFGRDGNPWNDSYRRVVEAELSQEALQDIQAERQRNVA